MSLGELKEWVEKRSKIPDDEDEVYVSNYKIEYNEEALDGDDKIILRVFFTTKRLIGLTQNEVEHICADATFKMVYLGYPMLMIGKTDKAKSLWN